MTNDCHRILVVDDDPDIVELHRSILELGGYRVEVAYGGDECREKVNLKAPDLIVLDIMMDTMGSGMFVAQDLRMNDATRDIPIIVVTSINSLPPHNVEPDEAWLPVDAFLEKPVTPDQLLEEVQTLLADK